MALNFNRIWASSQNPAYPTDAQTARGLSFLGTEEPTFDLHDAMFKELDIKALWLYDQVRLACERFGQSVDSSLNSGTRDTMANAITAALLSQRKADEGGYGIVKMANGDTTKAGQEYNQAVSPKHLAEYVSEQNTWQNIRDKPQTATRWPSFDEVTGKPALGTAAAMWQNLESVERLGGSDAEAASTRQLVELRGMVYKKVESLPDGSRMTKSLSNFSELKGSTNEAATTAQLLELGNTITPQRIKYAIDNQNKADELGYGIVKMANKETTESGTEYNQAVSPAHLKEVTESKINAAINNLPDGSRMTKSLASVEDLKGSTNEATTTAQLLELKNTIVPNLIYRSISSLPDGSRMTRSTASVYDLKGSIDEATTTAQTRELLDKLGGGAYMSRVDVMLDNLGGSNTEVASTRHIVDLRNKTITGIRMIKLYDSNMLSGGQYGGGSGEFISALKIQGAVDGNGDYVSASKLQYQINGQWVDVKHG